MINQKFIEVQRLIKNFMKTHPYIQYYLETNNNNKLTYKQTAFDATDEQEEQKLTLLIYPDSVNYPHDYFEFNIRMISNGKHTEHHINTVMNFDNPMDNVVENSSLGVYVAKLKKHIQYVLQEP